MNDLRKTVMVILSSQSSDLEVSTAVEKLDKENSDFSNSFLAYYYDSIGDIEITESYLSKIKDMKKLEELALKDANLAFSIALLHGVGLFFEENITEMLKFLEISSKGGNPLADLELGYYSLEQETSEEELMDSITHFENAISKGLYEGYLSIAEIYMELNDFTEARKYFNLAIDNGLDGYLGLSVIELELKHKFKTEEFLLKSYKMKPTKDTTFLLGGFYLDIKKSIDRALPYFEESDSLGSEEASFALGLIYYLGEEIKQDLGKSFNYFSKAAHKGELGAIFYIGLFYFDGIFVEKNEEEGLKWLEIAADSGDEDAIEFLSNLE